MSTRFRLTCLIATILMGSQLFAAGNDLTDEDIEALRDWINSKRMVTIRELGGQFSISGDIQAELQTKNEVKRGQQQRKGHKPFDNYDVEFNLNLDYRADRAWAAGRIRFDNDAGVVDDFFGSGSDSKIKVPRAYFGYRLIDRDKHTMDIEVGRRSMLSVFDSRLQFFSNFDGATFKDNYAFQGVGDFYYQLGVFLINERVDRMGLIGETGLQNIANTGFYTKYSLIDWDTKHTKNIPQQFQFITSQLILGYKFIPQMLNQIVTLYCANLYNHRARENAISDQKKANFGGYLGFSIGQLKLKGDWSLDANYQVLAGQCIPDFDVSGVGMGNTDGNGFYFSKGKDSAGKPIPIPSTRATAEGNVNYRGFEITLQYLLTNNINLWQQWAQSITLDDEIGPFRRFKQFEIALVFLF